MMAMLLLWVAVGIGVVTQLPRLRSHYAQRNPSHNWDHFLVQTQLRPVPAAMSDVVTVAALMDIPAPMLDRAALGRTSDKELLLVATLTNDHVLIGVRRASPVPATSGIVVVDGWQLEVLPGPATTAWEVTTLRRSPTPQRL